MEPTTISIPALTPAGLLLSSEPFPLPELDDFVGEFLPDDRLDELLGAILRHYSRFASFEGLRIRVLWQKDAGDEDGRLKLGSLSKQNNMTRYLAGVDYVVTVNLTAAIINAMTNWQIEACLFHQLMHIEVETKKNGEIKLKTAPHDMALFYAEVLNYGAWTLDLANTSNAFRQQPLWDDRAPAAIAPEKSLPPVVHDALDNTIATISWTNADGSERSFAATSLTKLKDVTKQATTRTVDGETFERDDLGRYVNTETGEYLDAFEVPRPMTTGR